MKCPDSWRKAEASEFSASHLCVIQSLYVVCAAIFVQIEGIEK